MYVEAEVAASGALDYAELLFLLVLVLVLVIILLLLLLVACGVLVVELSRLELRCARLGLCCGEAVEKLYRNKSTRGYCKCFIGSAYMGFARVARGSCFTNQMGLNTQLPCS